MEEGTFTAEEVEAGIKELGISFGFYATLDRIARYLGCSDDEASKLSYYEFYSKSSYLSHVSKYQKNLKDIFDRKRK